VCDSMLMDPHSRTHSLPAISARGLGNSVQHEASVSRVDAEQVFYMAQRGIPEKVARSLIVNGFADDVVKRFPLRYSMEIRHLLDLELSSKVG
jgi:Fe-S cluster assembly protein SufB